MRAAQSRLVVNSVTLSSFAEGRMRLFGAETFNNFSVAIAVSKPGWKQRIRAIYLLFTFRILENSCRHSALITALFTMGGGISI